MVKRILIVLIVTTCLVLAVAAQSGHPTPAKASLKFPQGKNNVEIPFTRFKDWIILKVRVNNSKELSFILDTGAPIAVLSDSKWVEELNLTVIGQAMMGGADGNTPKAATPLASVTKFTIGEIEIEGGLAAIGVGSEAITGTDGIIGKYIFDGAVVRVNWKESKLLLTKPESFIYNGTGESIPLLPTKTGHYFTEIKVEKNGNIVSAKAIVDLGNRSGFFIDKSTGAGLVKNQKVISNTLIGWGANGPVTGDISRVDLTIGENTFKNIVTGFKEKPGILENEGYKANIGISVLSRFDLIFDCVNKRLILEKNSNYSDSFSFNRSGILLAPQANPGFLLVADILATSPAKAAGMMKGDKVLSINGTAISDLATGNISSIIKGIGHDVLKLLIQRGSEKLTVSLILKDDLI